MKTFLEPADILSLSDYEKIRPVKRAEMIQRKKNRRVSVGPYATFSFENYDTMWMQVQEMLRIEKGGDAQLEDELRAYNPMIPNGRELTATVMFEIEDPARRAEVLKNLGGVQEKMELRFAGETICGIAEKDLDYTSADGKASSVQFVHFPFSPEQIKKFAAADQEITLAITQIHYRHMAIMSENARQELAKDFG